MTGAGSRVVTETAAVYQAMVQYGLLGGALGMSILTIAATSQWRACLYQPVYFGRLRN